MELYLTLPAQINLYLHLLASASPFCETEQHHMVTMVTMVCEQEVC